MPKIAVAAVKGLVLVCKRNVKWDKRKHKAIENNLSRGLSRPS